MSEAFQTYDRTLRLPCDGIESGRPHKTHLDDAIKDLAKSLEKEFGPTVQWDGKDDNGNLMGTLKGDAYVVSLQTKFGQNLAFAGTERRSFVSYGIRAEGRVPALEKADHSAEEIRRFLKVAGGIAGPVVLFFGFSFVLDLLGFVIIPYLVIGAALLLGVWCGSKLGDLAGSALERRALDRAEKRGVVSKLDRLWETLTLGLDGITREYERV